MAQVPEYIQNVSDYLNLDQSSLPQWEAALIAQIRDSVQKEIKEHFEKSAATRQMFVSLPTEIW